MSKSRHIKIIPKIPATILILIAGILRRRISRSIARRRFALTIKAGLKIGENCHFDRDIYFGTKPYLIKVGNHVDVSAGAIFVTHAGADTWMFGDAPEYSGMRYWDTIEIKDNCFIGVRVTFLPGVTIGPNSIVGAGSVVTRDVPPNTVVMGNPARPVCSVNIYKQLIRHRSFSYSPEFIRSSGGMRKAIERNLEELHARQRSAQGTEKNDSKDSATQVQRLTDDLALSELV